MQWLFSISGPFPLCLMTLTEIAGAECVRQFLASTRSTLCKKQNKISKNPSDLITTAFTRLTVVLNLVSTIPRHIE
jgi:hypothetical protein